MLYLVPIRQNLVLVYLFTSFAFFLFFVSDSSNSASPPSIDNTPPVGESPMCARVWRVRLLWYCEDLRCDQPTLLAMSGHVTIHMREYPHRVSRVPFRVVLSWLFRPSPFLVVPLLPGAQIATAVDVLDRQTLQGGEEDT